MNWGAHKVDGRIAAKAATKIRAALRQSIDAKRVYQLYKESDPAITDNEAQDNARARAWAMLNVRPNNNATITALQYLWAEGFVLGEDSAREAIREAREAKKEVSAGIDWDNWKPGNRPASLLIQPPKAFQKLLEKQGVAIKGLDQTGYDRIGTALARSIRLGLGDTSAAKLINDAVGSPARALSIAITETNRAVSLGAIKTYREAKLEKMEWAVSDPCPECAQNSGQVIDIGGTFNSGAQQPPAHPHCRCALLPVIPDYETNELGVVDVAPNHPAVETYYGKIPESKLQQVVDYQATKKYPKSRGWKDTAAAYDVQDYNGLPTVLPEDEFNELLKGIEYTSKAQVDNVELPKSVRVYRGIASSETTRGINYADEYLYGEHFAGYGLYGNGTYSTPRLETALAYTNDTRGSAVIEMIIPDTSNFVEYEELWKLRTDAKMAITDASGSLDVSAPDYKEKRDMYREMNRVLSDDGTAATLMGYDGIYIKERNYYVILNRGKVIANQKIEVKK